MNIEIFDIIEALTKVEENVREDGSINWDFVSADLHIDHREIVAGLEPLQEDDLFDFVAKRLGV